MFAAAAPDRDGTVARYVPECIIAKLTFETVFIVKYLQVAMITPPHCLSGMDAAIFSDVIPAGSTARLEDGAI